MFIVIKYNLKFLLKKIQEKNFGLTKFTFLEYTKKMSSTNVPTTQAYTESSPSKSERNSRNRFIFFELHIQIKERPYVFKPNNLLIDYEVSNLF